MTIRSTVEAAHELHGGEKAEAKITIARPVSEVFLFCSNFENLARFMANVKRTEVESPLRTKWTYLTHSGVELEIETELIAEAENRMISWQTTPGSAALQAGSIWFAAVDSERGAPATEVHMLLRYTSQFAETLGENSTTALKKSLSRLREIVEASPTEAQATRSREPQQTL